jgi:hypothetical protein
MSKVPRILLSSAQDLFLPLAENPIVLILLSVLYDRPFSSSGVFCRPTNHANFCSILSSNYRPHISARNFQGKDVLVLTLLLRLNIIHTVNVRVVVTIANGMYSHQAGLDARISMFIPKRL